MTHFRGNSCLNNLMVFAKDMTDSWATVAIKKISLVRDVRYIIYIYIYNIYIYILYGHTYRKSEDQPGKVSHPGRGQLNRENEYFPARVRA